MKYKWEYGDNGSQTYYKTEIGKDYLCIYANKESSNPKMYMAMYIKNKRSVNIWDKKFNDKMRKQGYIEKDELLPTTRKLLSSEDIEYMKKKLIYCYENDKLEITPQSQDFIEEREEKIQKVIGF